MKKLFVTILLTFLMAFPGFSTDQSSEIKPQKFVLANGLTILVTEMPSSPTVSIFGLVKTGAATEGKYLGTGISHFLEHMLFKGTEKRGVGKIASEVQALGGQINASTGFDYTIYTLTLPQSAFDEGLDIISDMLMNSKFDPVEIDKEREVVYGEMQLYWDRPDRQLSRMVFETVYQQHPYGVPVIGYESLLRTLTRDDFVDYYRTHYAPNNIIISIAGNVRSEDVIPQAAEIFKDFARKPVIPRNLVPEPVQISQRFAQDEYPTELTRISLAYASVGLRDPDLYPLDVLAMILGQGQSSRLYKKLFIERDLVKSVTASNFTPLDPGVFEIEMVLDDKNREEAQKIVKDQIALIVQKGVDASELIKVKQQIRAQHIFSNLTSDAVANNAASDEAFTGDADFSREYVEGIARVTSDEVQRVAKKYLIDQRLSQVILKPKSDERQHAGTVVEKKKPKIKKIVFANGLTVLLRENKGFPIVSINLAMNGGSAEETSDKLGVSELVSRVMLEGTKSRTYEEITQSLESRGASLVPFSGRNSFGLMYNSLADDLDFGTDLIADVIKNPIFSLEEINREKNKILTSLIAQQDSISSMTSRKLRETLFVTHPFRRDGLGTPETIQKIDRDDLVHFYKKYVVPNNMIISIFGDIDADKVTESLRQKLGALKKAPVEISTFSENPPSSTREETIYLDKQQAMVMVGFQGADLLSPDRDGLQVLSAILGSSFNGRIFVKIRDEFGKAYTLGGGFSPSRDMGMLTFYVLTTDDQAEAVKDLLLKILKDIREHAVSQEELTDIKTYIKGSFEMNLQTDSALGFTTVLDELYGSGYHYYQSFEKRIDAITSQDVLRLAKKYLDLNNAAIVIARPASKEHPKQ